MRREQKKAGIQWWKGFPDRSNRKYKSPEAREMEDALKAPIRTSYFSLNEMGNHLERFKQSS